MAVTEMEKNDPSKDQNKYPETVPEEAHDSDLLYNNYLKYV